MGDQLEAGAAGDEQRCTHSDRSGSLTLELAGEGEVRVVASAPQYLPIELRETPGVALEIVLERGGVLLRGSIMDIKAASHARARYIVGPGQEGLLL